MGAYCIDFQSRVSAGAAKNFSKKRPRRTAVAAAITPLLPILPSEFIFLYPHTYSNAVSNSNG